MYVDGSTLHLTRTHTIMAVIPIWFGKSILKAFNLSYKISGSGSGSGKGGGGGAGGKGGWAGGRSMQNTFNFRRLRMQEKHDDEDGGSGGDGGGQRGGGPAYFDRGEAANDSTGRLER